MTTDRTAGDDARAIRITDYLDGEMSAEERQQFELELASDEELRCDLEAGRTALGAVSEFASHFAPDDFVDVVESRVRTRSRGRFFGHSVLYTSRIPYEVFAVVAIAVMSAMLALSSPEDAAFNPESAVAQGEGDVEPGEGGAPSGAGGATGVGESAGAGVTGKEVEVRPLKTEVIEYRLTLRSGKGATDLGSLARRIRGASRKYVVTQGDGNLTVQVPASEIDGFLKDWGGPGATLERDRRVVAGPVPDHTVVRIQYDR